MRAYLNTSGWLLRVLLTLSAVAATSVRVRADEPAAPQLTRAPELLQFKEAPYPQEELASRRGAAVVLALTISATGTIEEASVQQSAGPLGESTGVLFDQAALAAAREFVFRPAEIDNVPSRIQILYRYEFTPPPAAPTHAVFAGLVKDRRTGVVLPGITVRLATGQSAVTDAAGHYEIAEVEPGEHVVTLEGPELPPLQTQEFFQAGQRLEAAYDVEPIDPNAPASESSDDMEIVVTAPPLRKQVVSTEVSAAQAVRVPGTQGDVLRVVENLPGVARGALGTGQLIVWGAEPQDTRVYVDGVPVPRLYHDGGLRSILGSDFVKSVDLVAGGYGSAFGRGLGGLVTIDTVTLDSKRTRGSVSLDVLDAQGSVQVPITEKLSAAVAMRRGHLADLLTGTVRNDIEDYLPIPRYYDGQARIRYQISDTQSLELTGLLSSDRLTRSSLSADPTRSVRERRDQDFQRLYLSYRVRAADGSTLSLTPYIGWDATRLDNQVGSVSTDLSRDSVLGGVRASWRRRAASWLTMEVGLDAELSRHNLRRNGSVGAPPREGDLRVFGQAPPDRISADTWHVTQVGVAPYIELDGKFFDGRLHVLPGLRVDPYIASADKRSPTQADEPSIGIATRSFALEPRLALRYELTDEIALKAGWGIYRQAPQPEDRSSSFGNPSLTSARAMHWVLGASWQILEGLSAEVTGFYSRSHDLPARSPLSSPLTGQALLARGEGRAYGQQLLLRQEIGKSFFGWISYSLVRSERRAADSGAFRLSDYDQTHVFTALASYDLGAGFEVGARLRYATGFPRTAVTDAYYDVRRDRYQPVFGRQNGLRIPAFFAVDVRGSKKFKLGDTSLDVYIEVQNVTNHENAEEIVYSPDYTERAYVTGLPILPIAGLKWTL
ncbi:MAG: TonB-dependent receptor [Polyangiales bacterium]